MADKARQAFGATGSTWTDSGFTASDFNSRASGSVVVAATAITNDNETTQGDTHIIVSFEFEVGGTTTANSRVDLYLLPEGQGGEFGDDAVTGTTVPARSYLVGQCYVKPAITSGNLVFGTFSPIPLPLGDFKLALAQHMGAALDASANAVVKHRTVILNLNG